MTLRRLVLCFFALILCTSALFAQSSASVSGTLVDPQGGVIVNADVSLASKANGTVRKAHTDARGHYTFSQVPPGAYSITAEFAGFSTTTTNIQLLVSTASTADLTMQLGSGKDEVVEVMETSASINTTDATLGNVIGNKPIVQLPLEGRNVTGLLALQPGVTFIKEPDTGAKNDYRSGSVNGGKADQANVLLDGVDANDQQNRNSFTSVLRVTPDSIQEFRTITSNPGAELGHSSGAQVTLVTKSGTNVVHGSVYEYNRNTVTQANSWINKQTPTAIIPRKQLNRNVFGASVGLPLMRDKLFFFANYEGRRDASASSQRRIVPNADFRTGIFRYSTVSGSTATLTPAQVKQMDPQGIGAAAAVLNTFQQYPLPNSTVVGDGLNTSGYVFNYKTPLTYNTYISRIDYNIDSASKHTIFWRGNMQFDNYKNGAPQFPGQAPSSTYVNFSKGYAVGYNWLISSHIVNSLRYGFTRQSAGTSGTQTQAMNYFYGMTPLYAMGSSSTTQVAGTSTLQQLPVHDIRDDVTWTKGRHSVAFGGEIMLLHNHYSTNSQSFSNGYIDALWLENNGAGLNAINTATGAAAYGVAQSTSSTVYNTQFGNLLGLIGKMQRRTVYDINGSALAEGSMVNRIFSEKHYDLYVQDQWRATPNLTLMAGIRYTASPAIFETQGYNVTSSQPLGDWLQKRGSLAASGQSQALAGSVTYDLASNTHKPLYPTQNNFAPRVSFAYSPAVKDGLLHKIFGDGKTSVRGGFGLLYDVFGQGLERDYSNAVGFSSLVQNAAGQAIATDPRYTGPYDVPFSNPAFPSSPSGAFPQTAGNLLLQSSTVDDNIKNPYSMVTNLTVGREFQGGWLVQASYVNRLSRRSMIGEDIAAPTNLVDPASGQSYFQAAKILDGYVKSGATTVPNLPFWENMWPGAAGGGLSATQNIYTQQFKTHLGDYTTSLLNLDNYCKPSCSRLGANSMFNAQYSALYAFRSAASGSYDGLQLLVRHAYTHGFQFDVNYTLSKCIDMGSTPESTGASTSTGSVLNTWNPAQMRQVCDYDLRHQLTGFGVWELPIGKGKMFATNANRVLDEVIGGWQLTSLVRATSGFAGSVTNGVGYPTVWNFTGYATQTKPLTGTKTPGYVTSTGPTGQATFTSTAPGDSGSRNVLRGDGIFTYDAGLAKRFHLFSLFGQQHTLQFRAEVFNLTNTVKLDINSASLNYSGSASSFGKYSDQLVDPRVMQFALRYEF